VLLTRLIREKRIERSVVVSQSHPKRFLEILTLFFHPLLTTLSFREREGLCAESAVVEGRSLSVLLPKAFAGFIMM